MLAKLLRFEKRGRLWQVGRSGFFEQAENAIRRGFANLFDS